MLPTARAALAAFLLAMVAPWAAAASPTQLDPSFNGDGLVTLHPVTGDRVLADMAVLKHGKTMVLVLTRDDPAFELHRLRQNGTPDPVFGGGDGVFAFGPAADYDDVHLAVDPHSGKAYVSAVLDDGTTQVTTVWRIENNGTSDSSYGDSGTGQVTFGDRVTRALLALPGGLLVMAGADLAAHTADVWRLDDAGDPDPGFGSDGTAVLSSNQNDEVTGLARQSYDKVVVAGDHLDATASKLRAYRLTKFGALDPSFRGDGRATIAPSSHGVATTRVWTPQVVVRPDNRTVFVAGLSQNEGSSLRTLFAASLTRAGAPDPAFVQHVYRGLSETSGHTALERDGKLVTAGFVSSNGGTGDAVIRLTTTGHLDPSWSRDGILPLTGTSELISLGITSYGRVEVGRTMGTGPFDTEVRALRGTPTPTCHGDLATQFGSGRNDTINGTTHADVLVGLDGDDVLKGLAGDDVICGNADDDTLIGGSGTDELLGGPGRDDLRP